MLACDPAKVTLTDDTDWNFTDTLKYCTSSKPFQV